MHLRHRWSYKQITELESGPRAYAPQTWEKLYRKCNCGKIQKRNWGPSGHYYWSHVTMEDFLKIMLAIELETRVIK